MNIIKTYGIIIFLFTMNILYGQTTCSTAVTQSTSSGVEYNLTNTQFWIKFTADTTFIDVQLFQASNSPSSQLLSVELYSGNCNSLNLLSSMNLLDSTMTENNLVIGSTYYLKLTQSQAVSSFSGIFLALPLSNAPLSCPTACNLVQNGCFEESNINVDLMNYFTTGNNPNVYLNPLFTFNQYNNNLSNVCGWFRFTSSPQLKRESTPLGSNYYMFLMYKGGGYGEDIVTQLNNGSSLNAEDYILRFKHKDINGYHDNTKVYLSNTPYYSWNYQSTAQLIANIPVNGTTWKQEEKKVTISSNQINNIYLIIHPDGSSSNANGILGIDEIQFLSYSVSPTQTTICEGENTTLTANLCDEVCPEDNFTVTYNWTASPNDPSLVGQETNPSISVSPTVTTTYTATATTNMGNTLTKTVTVTVNPVPDVPVFTGDFHTCNGTSNYIINNPDPNATYSCSVLNPSNNTIGNINVIGNNTFTINWNNFIFYSHYTIQLEVSYGTGCSSVATLDVFPCCTNGATYTDVQLTGVLSGQTLAFNGTIIVPAGANLVIDNGSQVYMGGNAKIMLETGATFELRNSTIEACGNNLWDGIYTENPSTSFIAENSIILDAKNAVVSNHGGNYKLSDITFDRSYINILVNDYSGDHMSEVFNSHFFGSTNLLYPHQNTKSKAAVELNNVIMNTKLIRIGSINGRNDISGFQNGIKSYNSDFVAFALDIYDCDYGVYLLGNESDPVNRRAIIGSSNPGFNCTLNDLTYAVNAYSKSDIYVYNCESNNCTFGVEISHSKETVISILHNNFSNVGRGISISDMSSEIYIQDNNILLTSGQASASLLGIQVLDNVVTTGSQTTYICDNTLSNPIYGILVNNTYDLQVINNTINQNPQPTSLALGIINTGNHSPIIADNHIESPASITLNASMINLRNGIYSNYTDFGRFINNNCIHNGGGMYFRIDNTNAEIGLNKLHDNWDGIHFEIADIGPNSQGQANNPWNNEWTGNLHKNMFGALTQYQPIDWFYQANGSYDPTLPPASIVTNMNTISTQNGAYSPLTKCISGTAYPPGEINGDQNGIYMMVSGGPSNIVLSATQLDSLRMAKLGGIINMFLPLSQASSLNMSNIANMLSNTNIYQNSSNTDYNKSRAVYYYLNHNESYLNLGKPNDFIFQGFYSWLNNSNIGKLDKIEQAMFKGDTSKASLLLTSFTPQNNIEIVSFEVYSIYNRSWAVGQYSFTPSDSATLISRAYQDPANSGPSVYLARNMLGLTLVDLGQSSVARTDNTSITDKQAEKDNTIFVYPNPASNKINIVFEKAIEGSNQIIIYNIFGQEIMHQQLEGNTKYSLNISSLKAGLYFYTIVSDNNVLKSAKFIKQ